VSWPPPSPPAHYVLRLFITGTTSRSQRAIGNIRRLCEEVLPGRYELEIIDVYLDPEATRDLQIVATPTLVKMEPGPVRRIVGDLSDSAKVLVGLGLDVSIPGAHGGA
jgi:circadian clock protein KaiB